MLRALTRACARATAQAVARRHRPAPTSSRGLATASAPALAAAPVPVRVAFLGSGGISAMHYTALKRLPEVVLSGVWSTAARDSLHATAQRYGTRPYDSLNALLRDPTTHAVWVLTPAETHAELATACMRAGKHVFVEKPVASDCAQLQQLMRVAHDTKRTCFAGHNYVYEPALQRAREMIAGGEIGRVTHISVQYNIAHPPDVAARYPGVIRQILTHHCYTLLYLTGGVAPTKLNAITSSPLPSAPHDPVTGLPREQQVVVNMALPDTAAADPLTRGCLVTFGANWCADDHTAEPWTFLVKVLGTKGGTRFSYADWVSTVRRSATQIHAQWYEAYQGGLNEIDRHFVRHVIAPAIGAADPTASRAPLSTLRDAWLSQALVDACVQSAATDSVVKLHDLAARAHAAEAAATAADPTASTAAAL